MTLRVKTWRGCSSPLVHWWSIEDYQKMRSNPNASPYLIQALAIAKFDPGMYEVVETFLP